VFPKAKRPPVSLFQECQNLSVVHLISRKFCAPVLLVGRGKLSMLRATMPKTSIYEDRQTFFAKHEIGLTGQALIATPAGDAIRSEDRDKFKFSSPITR
jgi:hypothetical protein